MLTATHRWSFSDELVSDHRSRAATRLEGAPGHLLGGLTAIAPERRGDIVPLGMRSLISGTLATMMTGAVIGLLT